MSPPTLPHGRAAISGLVVPVAVLLLLVGATSSAEPTTAPAGMSGRMPSDAAALRLLERAAQAPSGVAYSGVQFVSAWGEDGATSLLVEVAHRPGHGTTVRSTGTSQSPAAETFLPARGAEPSVLGAGSLQLLADNYRVVTAGRGSVSGRTTDIVEARWQSGRAAARFWLDSDTGLVLRREVYDQEGRTTRASAFVEVSLGEAAGHGHLPPAMPDAWSDEVDYSDREQMRAKGWHCPDELPGSLDLVDARRGGGHEAPILHLSYSDGLATVSVFEQLGRLDHENLDGYRRETHGTRSVYVRPGVPERVVWSADGTVFTVVADAPPATVDKVVAALPHEPVEDGTLHRLGRGLDRVASWFNPFG